MAPATTLPAYTGVQSGSDYTLVRLEKVEAGPVDQADKERLAQQLSGAWGQAENEAMLRMLRDEYKVQVMPAAAGVIRGDQPAAG